MVALYGVLLAGAGLTLCFQTRNFDGFWVAGIGALVAGVLCVRLASDAVHRPRGAALDVEAATATEPEDAGLAAARVVIELEDLQRQLDELTEQCVAFDVRPADLALPVQPQAAPRPPQPSDPRIEPAGTVSVRIALPLLSALTLTALLGRHVWGRARH